MLQDFRQCLYTDFVFGKDSEKCIGEELKKLGAHTVLVHHDSGRFLYDTGLLENVKTYLTDAGLKVVELGGVKPNPRVSLVREGIELCKKENVDFLLAIGGGSTIDSTKAIAFGMKYDGDVWDLYSGKAVPTDAMPLAVILTYPATGSESSKGSVITNEELVIKNSCGAPFIRSALTIMNPELTYTLPPYLTACGVTDMYIHIVERYFVPETRIGSMDYLCEATMRALLNFGPKVLADPTNYENRAEIMWIGTIAHNDTMGLGRVQDWSSHGMGHEISALYDTAHGATLSIMTPAWMRYVYKQDIPRFVRYATEVFGVEYDPADPERTAIEGINRTEAFFKSLGMPTSFAEANLPTDKIEHMAEQAAALKGGLLGNFKKLSKDDIVEIYKLAIK